jgi:hypothetical protein
MFQAMAYPHKIQSFLGLALMLCLVSFVPAPTWAACKNSGGSAGSQKFGSQVSGNSVTICASAVQVTPSRTAVVKSPPKITAKVVVKTVDPKKAIFRRQPPRVVPAPAPKPPSVSKRITKVVTKAKPKLITKPGTANLTADTASFSPAQVVANVHPSNQLAIGQVATFSVLATTHFRSGRLLGSPTEVRFTPISTSWVLSQGSAGFGNTLHLAFDSTGSHTVHVAVTYSVAYRYKGLKNWVSEPDTIQVVDDLFVEVSEPTAGPVSDEGTQGSRRVLLVGESCPAISSVFGCN